MLSTVNAPAQFERRMKGTPHPSNHLWIYSISNVISNILLQNQTLISISPQANLKQTILTALQQVFLSNFETYSHKKLNWSM